MSALAYPISRYPAVNVATVPQRSPLRYPGGKTWLIPHIRAWLNDSQPAVLIEPFAGGGIVSLTAIMEGLAEQAIMVELDHDVAALWHAALRDGDTLAEQIEAFEPTLESVLGLDSQGITGVMDHAFRTLVYNRTRRSGILAAGASFMKNGENGRGIQSRWYPKTLAQRLRDIHDHADRIAFFEGDGTALLQPLLMGWGSDASVFIDPPYTAAGGKRAGARLYAHNEIDHSRLFGLLADTEASFLMTYDSAPEIVSLVNRYGFHAVIVEMKNAHHNRMPELVITRDPLFA